MKLRRCLSCLLVFIFMSTTGCSSSTKTNSTAAPTSVSTVAVTPTPAILQVLRSKTSGKVLNAPVVYKPIGIMIENSPAARPQTGLQSADVVYEAPVEGSYTRFFCLFNDTLPTTAGPVRSARVYFMRLQQEWDSAYVHFGGTEGVNGADIYSEDVSKHIKTRINFLKGNFTSYYWRSKDRIAPHNAYTNLQKLQTLMQQEANGRTFQFDENSTYPGNAIAEITIPFNGSITTYKYDSKNDVLVRYMGGKEFKDAATNKAITVKNLIVQFSHFHHDNLPSGLWLCDLVGSGKAEFFINGKHVIGTWERSSYESPTVYKDANGKEIVLRPGNTWIAVHPDNVNITVK